MVLWNRVWPLVVGVVLLPCGLVWGAEEKAKDGPADGQAAAAQKALTAEEIAKLVAELDADRYADRQAASDKLAAAGKAVIPAVAKAAVGESLEATVRAIDILRKYHESADESTRSAAKEALETIAKSDRAAAARRAQDILKPKPTPAEEQPAPAPAPGGARIIIGGGNIIQGGIQIAAAAAGNGKKISVKNVNGVKDIDVEENEKKIKIHDDPQQGIKIEVTTKKDGKDKTDKYEAKDAEELKKKHPEGYKIYKEYGQNQGGGANVQIQIGGFAPGVPVPVPGIAPVPVQGNRIEAISRLLKSLASRLELLLKDEQLPQAPQQSKDNLKKQLDELKQQIAELEKRLKEEPKKAEEKKEEKVER